MAEKSELCDPLLAESRATILLVDDNPSNLVALQSILDQLDLRLVEAPSGEDALRLVGLQQFAVILLDVLMPGLDGFETAKLIREQQASQHTPIIFLTAQDIEPTQLEQGYLLGAVDFIVKPISAVVLRSKVTALVNIFQVQKKAKRETEQLRLLVEGTQEYAIFMLDPTGRVVTWNPGAQRIKQYKADEIVGSHFSRFYPPQAVEAGWPEYELKAALMQDRFEDEGWRVRKDGTQFWANVVITALKDEAGNLRAYSKITRDMTERKQAEESARRLLQEEAARRASEEQREWLRVTLDSIGDAVITTDTEGRITFLNPVAQRLTGWSQADAQGQPLTAVFAILNEQTREPVENPVSKVLSEGVIVGLANHTVLLARDGSVTPIDDSAAPIRDSMGSLLGVVLVFRDVSGQRQAQNEIRESEARKSAILNTALDCIVTMDHVGRVVEFNPAAERVFGFNRVEAVGRELATLIIPPSLRERHRTDLAHFLATGEGPVLNKRLEVTALRSDGSEFPAELAIAKIPVGDPLLFTAYLRDITERIATERHRGARLAVTQALSQATNISDAATGVLRSVCQSLEWDLGLFWTVADDRESLVCKATWRRPEFRDGNFEANSCGRTFRKGEGLPGRVWSTGQPTWIPDLVRDENFPRGPSAAEEGLHSAFACPVGVADETLGVIEFFSRRIREPDADLLELMATVGGNVGQFIERKLAEQQVRESEAELSDFFENATIGLHWVGPDGTVLRANNAELEMLGYSPAEYIGRSISEFHVDQEVICDILKRLQRGEKLNQYPSQLRCKDGSIKDVLIDSSVMWKDGEFIHTRCFTRDVTQRNRAEAALKEAERRFKAVFNQQFQFMVILDPHGTVLEANETCFSATGVERDQVVGRPFWEAPWWDRLPATQELWKRHIASAIDCGRLETGEIEYLLADGTLRSASAVLTRLKDDSGRFTSIVIEARDDTERKRFEADLRTSEERLRLALDAGRMGVLDWKINSTEIQWSESLEPLHGLAPGQFDGTLDGFQELIHPSDRASVTAAILRAVEQGSGCEVEFRNIRPTGAVHWIAGKGKVFANNDGQPARMIGVGMDVTQDKRSEQTARFLTDASATLAGLVDFESTLQKVASLAVPYFADWATVDMVHNDGTLRRVAVAHVDPAKVELAHDVQRRFPADPADPRGVWNILRTGHAEMVSEITDELLARSIDDDELLGIMRELGLKSYIGVPLSVRGKTLGVISFIAAESGHQYDAADLALAKDLASRAAIAVENSQLYRELKDADRRKDEFLATLAHELRNPLAPIRNSLQILKMPRLDAETIERSREMMERQVQHLVRLVDDLLDVSRVMRGKIELRKEPIELASIVARAVEMVQPLLDAQSHQLTVTLPPESLQLDADPIRLAQVVGNLLTNAAKYTEAGGHIRLSTKRTGDEVVLRVVDSGIGIDPAMLPKIFDLFVQVDHAATRSQGGLGIGLTLVRNLVEMHNGSVEAHSAGLGQGSQFVVRLPLLPLERESPIEQDNRQRPAATPPSGHRLMVVDDNKDAADSLAALLRLQGHEVRVAHNGPAALDMVKSYQPELIFLDIGMPGMDGYEVARELRKQPALANVQLAALTGWGQQEDRRRSKEAGFDHHLVKPAEPRALDELLTTLRRRSSK